MQELEKYSGERQEEREMKRRKFELDVEEKQGQVGNGGEETGSRTEA